ncbi:NifU family protein [Thermomonospora amylolytica]|uniref:NifU family protein n=1 Tax=Thermomonospora amylolytica TaxID=1411117 RepID=UPI000E6B7617|nr:NifU family protein [Thermomonospora amylolytica]
MADRAGPRLDAAAVAERLDALEDLLAHLEQVPGATAGKALDAVALLTELYGEALARIVDHLPPDAAGPLVEDDLVGHLLVLHDLHPLPVAERAARALARLRPALQERGADADLVAIENGVARVRLQARGCGSGLAPIQEAVEAALTAAAPELSGVEPVQPERPPAFVPAESLFRRPATTAAEGPA